MNPQVILAHAFNIEYNLDNVCNNDSFILLSLPKLRFTFVTTKPKTIYMLYIYTFTYRMYTQT